MTNPLLNVKTWLYNLGEVDAGEAAKIGMSNADLVVVDYAVNGRPHTPAELNVMRGGENRLIVSYISIGEAEDYRPYWLSSWDSNPPSFLSASNPEWPDNFKVKYWEAGWKAIIFKYVDQIIASGFNGIYMDIVDAYQYWEEIDPVPGMNYAQEMAKFVAAIRLHAEQKLAALGDTRQFVIMGQNAEELIANPTYRAAIDGMGKEDLRFYYENGHEGDFAPTPNGWYAGSKPYLELAEANGIQVFVVEYMTKARQTQYASTLLAEVQYLNAHGMSVYIAEDRDLPTIYAQPLGVGIPVYGTRRADVIPGSALADTIDGRGGNDLITGLAGNDRITGGTGADAMAGGAGNDTYLVDNAADQAIEVIAGGVDTVLTSASYALAAGWEIESLQTTSAAATVAINLTGNAIGQRLIGNNGANRINGGAGADTMYGYRGNDIYVVDNAADRVVEPVAGGTDTILSAVSYTLAAGLQVEALQTTSSAGTKAINLTSNELAQRLIGNNGANILSGGGGADSLFGGGGMDTLAGGAHKDTFVFNTALSAARNVDRITDFAVPYDTIQLENAIFTTLRTVGTLSAAAFHVGGTATAAAQHILYNPANGWLSYDVDGNGARPPFILPPSPPASP